ncbi:MAG: alpha/beta hydrolase [Pseudomonadota bacterium]
MGPAVDLPPGAVAWDQGFTVNASDGVPLRCAIWEGSGRGLALLLSGRTEFLEKMALPATGLVERGFTVACLDWRGQGLSGRTAEPWVMGHVDRFEDYDLDVAALMQAPQMADRGPIRLMLAHSMGGAIGLGAIYRGVIEPEAMVLSAPMLGLKMSAAVRFAGYVTTKVAAAFGQLDKRPPFGEVDRPYVFEGFDGNVLTSDRAVFDWMVAALTAEPRLQLAMPSLRWFDEANKAMAWLQRQGPLGIPCQFLRGSLEGVVDPGAIRQAADLYKAELVEIAGAQHEVLIESAPMREAAWAAIDRFLEQTGR